MSGSLLVPASLASRIRLLLVMTRREVELRYRDAMLGRIWIIVSPFLLLLIYTFVFGFVLKSRWEWKPEHALLRLDPVFRTPAERDPR